ncbi:MAG: RNA methyltransferase [candidate division KSB1 bacterium]|nr:RNA methyltransferase [candidate division KSB1 bacterium]MDZ7342037.1 RNA methyltransferase [candidate division KSB1 bacterium]
MKKLTYLDGILATPSLEDVHQRPRRPVSVVLDNIRSLYNVGSIFRTSDAAGVEKLYLTGITGQPPRLEISKAALGADQSVPWEYVADPVSIVQQLKARGYSIVVLEHTDQSCSYHEVAYRFPLCLIVGHEISGISDAVVELADIAVEIPMFGLKRSLNVAVAYGIAIYEIVKQYHGKS